MGQAVDVWAEVRRLRPLVADQIEGLGEDGWSRASWCDDWRVRDVLGHLVHLAEASHASMLKDVLSNGALPDRALSKVARQLGDTPVPELAQRLRQSADGKFHVPGSPKEVALGDLLVHGCDALRAVGQRFDPPPADAAAVLDIYWKVGRIVFHASAHSGKRLVATDADWQRGSGQEITGEAMDLLLLMANRRQVIERLGGPGVQSLEV